MGMYDVTKESYKVDEELAERGACAIRRLWNEIASDVLACDDADSISRAGMLEVCLDANRLEDFDMEAARYVIWMNNHKKSAWTAFLKKYFPYKRY